MGCVKMEDYRKLRNYTAIVLRKNNDKDDQACMIINDVMMTIISQTTGLTLDEAFAIEADAMTKGLHVIVTSTFHIESLYIKEQKDRLIAEMAVDNISINYETRQ